MLKAISVNVLLKSVIAGLTVLVIAMLALGAWNSWTGLVVANRIAAVTEASGYLFTALHNLRLDRTGSYRDLVGDRQLSALNPQVKANRDAEMPALRAAVAALAAVDLPDRATIVGELAGSTDWLAALQVESAAAMMKPKAERRAALAQEYWQLTTALFDTVDKLTSRLTRFVKLQDAMIDQLLILKQLAWDMRNSGGDASMLISSRLAGQPLPADAVFKHDSNTGGANALWAQILDLAGGMQLPAEFSAAVEKTRAVFFDKDYMELRTSLIRTLAAGGKTDITAEKWLAMSAPKLATALTMAEIALGAAKDHAVRQRANAVRALSLQLVLLVAAAGLALAMMLMVSRRVTSPLQAIQEAMLRLAGGDMAAEASFPGRCDEIGKLATAMATFKDSMVETDRLRTEQKEAELRAAEEKRLVEEHEASERQAAVERQELAGKEAMHKVVKEFESAVGGIIGLVSASATQLEATAGALHNNADSTQQHSNTVAAAAEEASANVETVASATEQLTASIHEISKQVHASSRIASQAVSQAEKTDARITTLSRAASRIGDVVKLITSVAEQTNLLALNATIEAARAGEAGRGFAVVAHEVKALAGQTAKATEEISTQISGMQTATQESVLAIKEISGTIGQISEIAASIASAVEQQGAATQEIARNVEAAAKGTAQVSANIVDVTHHASETGAASAQMLSSAQSLSQESRHLKTAMDSFLDMVRTGLGNRRRADDPDYTGPERRRDRVQRPGTSRAA